MIKKGDFVLFKADGMEGIGKVLNIDQDGDYIVGPEFSPTYEKWHNAARRYRQFDGLVVIVLEGNIYPN